MDNIFTTIVLPLACISLAVLAFFGACHLVTVLLQRPFDRLNDALERFYG